MSQLTDNDFSFELLFDGEALKHGQFSVRDLAPSLVALADLVEKANELSHGKDLEIDLRVQAGFRRGSFLADLVVNFPTYQGAVDLLTSDDVQAWATVTSLLGISGIGAFQFLKKSKGVPPEKVVEIERTEKIRVTFQGGEIEEFDRKVIDLVNDAWSRQRIEKVVEPLTKDGIDTFGFNAGGKKSLRVSEDEVKYLAASSDEDNKIISTTDVLLKIVSPSFNRHNKWRVSDGTRTFYAAIVDRGFKDRIEARKELFGAGDFLRCRLTTAQWLEDGGLKSSYEIEEVYRHIQSDESKQVDIDEI